MKKALLIVLSFCVFSVNVYAESCPSEEKVNIGKKAANLKVEKEEKTAELDKSLYSKPDDFDVDEEDYVDYYDYFNINFYNISKEFYLIVTNASTGEQTTIKYEDTNDGKYSLEHDDLSEPTTYKYSVYGSTLTTCNGITIKEGLITVPALNPYYRHAKCQDYPDYYLCQKYVNSPVDYEAFERKINDYKEKHEVKEEKKKSEPKKTTLDVIKEFILKNKYIICGAVLTIVVTIIVVSVIVRKKRVI